MMDQTVRWGVVVSTFAPSYRERVAVLQQALQEIEKLESPYSLPRVGFKHVYVLGGDAAVVHLDGDKALTRITSSMDLSKTISAPELLTAYPSLGTLILAYIVANNSRDVGLCCSGTTLCGSSAVFGPRTIVTTPTPRGEMASIRLRSTPQRGTKFQLHIGIEAWRLSFARRADFRTDATGATGSRASSMGQPPLKAECSVLAARRSLVVAASDTEEPRLQAPKVVDSFLWPSLNPLTVVSGPGHSKGDQDAVVDYHLGGAGTRLYSDFVRDFGSSKRSVPISRLVLSAAPLRTKLPTMVTEVSPLLLRAFNSLPFVKSAKYDFECDTYAAQGGGYSSDSASIRPQGESSIAAKVPVAQLPTAPSPVPIDDAVGDCNAWPMPSCTYLTADQMQQLSPAIWLRLGLPLAVHSAARTGAETATGSSKPAVPASSSMAKHNAGVGTNMYPSTVQSIREAARVLLQAVYRRGGAASAISPDDPLAGLGDEELERLQNDVERRRRYHGRKKFTERFKAAKSSFVKSSSYTVARRDAEAYAKKEGIHVAKQGLAKPTQSPVADESDNPTPEQWAIVMGPSIAGAKRKQRQAKGAEANPSMELHASKKPRSSRSVGYKAKSSVAIEQRVVGMSRSVPVVGVGAKGKSAARPSRAPPLTASVAGPPARVPCQTHSTGPVVLPNSALGGIAEDLVDSDTSMSDSDDSLELSDADDYQRGGGHLRKLQRQQK